MYSALIRSKVMYGLESAEVKEAGLRRLNVFQLKGLRQILGIVTTYVDRENTNTKVLEEATKALNTGGTKRKREIELLSETHTKQRITLAGKILRCADNDPRRFTTYRAGEGTIKMKPNKRVGRPRKNWGHTTHERIWERIRDEVGGGDEIGDALDREQQDWIRDAATLGMI